ncbi:MAG: hypothetical protein K2P81_01720 [Bacteriovoracaceae bacterium]|nr:hypothetical protein [Bacteriovoracaceae bacterium]
MFLPFFYHLRDAGIPSTPGELMDLYKVLEAREKLPTLEEFYLLARLTLVKDVKYYDKFQMAFAAHFKGLVSDQAFHEKLNQWLEEAKKKELSEEQIANAPKLPSEELLKELQKRLEEQKERHDGGNRWIGTGGTSPFGHSGQNSQGLRIGGQSGNQSALAVLGGRSFREYRTDETFNVRQLKLALKGLRRLGQWGRPELSISETVKKSSREGEIELVYKKPRKNQLKLLLLLDAGGSMAPYAKRVDTLFSAAHQLQHFKEFKVGYFHNITYDFIYHDAGFRRERADQIEKLQRLYDSRTRVIWVGDASMAPYELFEMNEGARYQYDTWGKPPLDWQRAPTGFERLQKMKTHWPHMVWLNPTPKEWWEGPTVRTVSELVPMYALTLDGLSQAVRELVRN